MLSSALPLASSLPNAFSAFGVGSVMVCAQAILVLKWPPDQIGIGTPKLLSVIAETSPLSLSLPIVFGFAFICLVYAVGQAVMGIAGRLRAPVFQKQGQINTAMIAQSDNAFLQKLYLEVRSSTAQFDGLGLSFFALFLCFSAVSLSEENFWIGVAMLFVSPMSLWVFWRESHKRIQEFNIVSSAYFLNVTCQ